MSLFPFFGQAEDLLKGAKGIAGFLGDVGDFLGLGGHSKAYNEWQHNWKVVHGGPRVPKDITEQREWESFQRANGYWPWQGAPVRSPTSTALGLTDTDPINTPPPGWGGGGTPPIVQQPQDSSTYRRTGVTWLPPWGGSWEMGTESEKRYYRKDPSAEDGAMPGNAMQQWGGCPPGYHLNKGDYYVDDPNGGPGAFKVHKGSRCVKNRHRNPLNPKALSSALRRVVTAKRAVKFLDKVHIGGSGVRTRYLPASSGHKSGCGCVVCKRR